MPKTVSLRSRRNWGGEGEREKVRGKKGGGLAPRVRPVKWPSNAEEYTRGESVLSILLKES